MNIKEAKEEMRNAITVYLDKDDYGNYLIPIEKQRPVFLMGPPGIGKTAIVEQIAQEMHIGLLTYSMTHHTRQSALGLPFIVHKSYEGMEFDISEYTMSEIIAAIYELMEKSHVKEGILFLDEINCVSETLAPAMLQFLQYKIFGRHRVPEGWVVVTAGNPPEFNDSAREFDVATWDRLKRIDTEADFRTWREYAINHGVHPAITTYLDIKSKDFYHIETTVNGKQFVTARGWEDLSVMIQRYEAHGMDVKEVLIAQYLQDPKLAKDFAVYYDLFNKYRSDYQVDEILNGNITDEIVSRAKAAKFDERLAVIGLLLDGIYARVQEFTLMEETTCMLYPILKKIKKDSSAKDADVSSLCQEAENTLREEMNANKTAGNLSTYRAEIYRKSMRFFQSIRAEIEKQDAKGTAAYNLVKKAFKQVTVDDTAAGEENRNAVDHMFAFAERAFGDGQELLVLVTELTTNDHCASFVSRYPSQRYYAHNQNLMFREQDKEIMLEMEKINLEEL